MHLSKITAHGFRASAQDLIECEIPGRFSVLIGANNAGKSTVCDALYLAHRLLLRTEPRQRRPSRPRAAGGCGKL